MRRDLVYFYPCPKDAVFNAFLRTANEKFGKNCKKDPNGNSISFGLNFSFRYNMNGGACTIHFMPYQNGTAINLRYSIVQAFGARYKRHAAEMTAYANNILKATGKPMKLDVNAFLSYAATGNPQQAAAPGGTAAPVQPPVQAPAQPPVQAPARPQPPVQQPRANQKTAQQSEPPYRAVGQSANQPSQSLAFCPECGKRVPGDAVFCAFCALCAFLSSFALASLAFCLCASYARFTPLTYAL